MTKFISLYDALKHVQDVHDCSHGEAIPHLVDLHIHGFLYFHEKKRVWVLDDEVHGESRGCDGCLGDGVDCERGAGCLVMEGV